MTEKMKDMTGMRFHRLLVIDCAGKPNGRSYAWNVVCNCGRSFSTMGSNLRSGAAKSCGCLQREKARAAGDRTRTHGMTNTSIYSIWDSMHQRCSNPNRKDFRKYGGRGINVCDAWKSFEQFLADMGPRPTGMSLDRINNDLGYSPKNCRWATAKQQARNQRTNRLITYLGETLCLSEWAEKLSISQITLQTRITKYKWSVERALTQPVQKHHAK